MVVIPSKIRKKIGIKEGDLLKVKIEGDKILLEKLSSEPFTVLADVIGEPYREEVDEVNSVQMSPYADGMSAGGWKWV